MNIGLIGLGKMGHAIAHRLIQGGHEVIGFDTNQETKNLAQQRGVIIAPTLEELAQKSSVIWLMLPAGKLIDEVLETIVPHLKEESIVIDGGNSHFSDSIRRYDHLKQKNIHFLDCGTSGGLLGEKIGFSLMIGGDKIIFDQLSTIFTSIAAPDGFAYLGSTGAGHYVKMVHNGVEYALLQAYAEGFHLLKEGHYKDLDLAAISNVWNHGSVIRSWILDLSLNIFKNDQALTSVSGEIGENLTGRWTADEAEKQHIPVDLIERSLAIRALSRQTGGNYATKVVALLRNQFGGHEVKKKS